MALLKSGKQMLRLSSVAKFQQKQQNLGIASAAASKYLFTTTAKNSIMIISHHGRFLSANNNNKYFSSIPTDNKEDDDFKLPPKTLKSFFTGFFRKPYSPPPPPPRTPFKELLEKFMDMVEESKQLPEDRLPLDIRPVLKELLYQMADESIVKFLHEFVRPTASPPHPVLDRNIKAIVDELPPHVLTLFQDTMVDVFDNKYYNILFRGIDWNFEPFRPVDPGMDIIADISDIGKENLKVFVLDNLLMVTGTDKADSPAPAYAATPKQMINLVPFPWRHDDIKVSILQDQQGTTKLKIFFPDHHNDPQVVKDRPRFFQINLSNYFT